MIKTAAELNLGDRIDGRGEVCALIRGACNQVVVQYRDQYTPPDAAKSFTTTVTSTFRLEDPPTLVTEATNAITALQGITGEALIHTMRRKEPYVTMRNFVLRTVAEENLYGIHQMVVVMTKNHTLETAWVGCWTDGAHDGFDVFETKDACVKVFLSELNRRLNEWEDE